MASGSMAGARSAIWETGWWSALRSSGNRTCEGAHLEGNFETRVVADRLDVRVTGRQRRAHDKLMTRATGT